MKHLTTIFTISLFLLVVSKQSAMAQGDWIWNQDENQILFSVSGFDGPEAVRYDKERDVYFISNFNGQTSGDKNGYISVVSSNGEIISLKFMTGTDEYPFDAGRGMFITGDTLWVADHSGIHFFNKFSGNHLGFLDLTDESPGFLNDITADLTGNLFVTDTGARKIYAFDSSNYELIISDLPVMPNGITTAPNGNLIIAPWQDGPTIYQLNSNTKGLSIFGTANGSDNYDGIEFYNGALFTSTQQDSSIHIMIDGKDQLFIKLPGRPADIAINKDASIIAVPYVSLNRVDFWKLKND